MYSGQTVITNKERKNKFNSIQFRWDYSKINKIANIDQWMIYFLRYTLVNLAEIHKNILFLKTVLVQYLQYVLTPWWYILKSLYT